ncbi:MAG: zinc ribbon domain-containing protein, partial [Clostridia bacterium]|nr:zinc ribbon domain-containing protein [Clostridia bacterium]
MYCPKCEKDLPADATFCPYCGNEKLTQKVEPAAEEPAVEAAVSTETESATAPASPAPEENQNAP